MMEPRILLFTKNPKCPAMPDCSASCERWHNRLLGLGGNYLLLLRFGRFENYILYLFRLFPSNIKTCLTNV